MSKKVTDGLLHPQVSTKLENVRQPHEAVFLSDIHLGTRSLQAKALASFLEEVDTRQLYLVGDIIDFWNLNSLNQYWSKQHTRVIKAIVKLVKRGTRVVYVPGNHDEVLREITPIAFSGFLIVDEAKFEFRGRRYLVIHGDAFDHMLKIAKPLYVLGAFVYDFLVMFNRFYNSVRRLFGRPYWSLSMYLKHRAKEAVGIMKKFESLALQYARSQGCDGVICGHIHNPVLNTEIGYFNCGDGIENLTYIGVTLDGVFYLGTYDFLGTS